MRDDTIFTRENLTNVTADDARKLAEEAGKELELNPSQVDALTYALAYAIRDVTLGYADRTAAFERIEFTRFGWSDRKTTFFLLRGVCSNEYATSKNRFLLDYSYHGLVGARGGFSVSTGKKTVRGLHAVMTETRDYIGKGSSKK